MSQNRPCAVLLLLCLVFGPLIIPAGAPMAYAYAREVPEDVAVRVLIGEAADQGLKGMICVGEVLRRRGSIKGFDGYRSKHINSEPRSVWVKAAKAWEHCAHTNYTKGADHFANIRKFGKPWWVRYCVKTYEYKDHVFYKEILQRA